MIALKTKPNFLLYSDNDMRAEIWNGIRRNEGIRAIDLDSISVSVQEGFVLLTGHLSVGYHRKLMQEIACSIPGVSAVRNDLVVDSDLTIQVSQALFNNERTRHLIIPVGCGHGWVRLGGVVPNRKLQSAVEEIAAQVPAVRGILSRPKVIGENLETERRPIQPLIRAKVYDHNRQGGIVTQVVIQPRNRLVTHVVVSTSDFYDGKFVFYEYLVPLEAFEVVNKESLVLKRNGSPLKAFPAFERTEYPLAPSDWQPPYPYTTGTVRWLCDQDAGVEDQSTSS